MYICGWKSENFENKDGFTYINAGVAIISLKKAFNFAGQQW